MYLTSLSLSPSITSPLTFLPPRIALTTRAGSKGFQISQRFECPHASLPPSTSRRSIPEFRRSDLLALIWATMAAANAPIIMREALTVRNSISAFTSFIFFHPFSLASTGVWGELFDSRRTAFFCALSAGSFDNSAVSYAWCCFFVCFCF